MGLKLTGGDLVVATHNPGKIGELTPWLSPPADKLYSAHDLDIPEPVETGASFEENAVLKARHAAALSGKPSLADDSGLCVYALEGAPGIYSARWAGPDKDFAHAMALVHEELQTCDDRMGDRAAFVCVLAIALPDRYIATVEGRCEGRLVWPPRGDKGFGYDPIFQPEGAQKTFGEMEGTEKKEISHRTKALEKFLEKFT